MNQRAGKTHVATLHDGDNIKFGDLLKTITAMKDALYKQGDQDAALRFEIFEDYLREDYKGGRLTYISKMIGL